MKKKSLKIIITLITIAVLGLIGIQFYWINLALKLEEEKFNKNVGNALSDLVRSIDDTETAKVLIKQLSPDDSNRVRVINKKDKKRFAYSSKFNSNTNHVMILGNDSSKINIEVNADTDSNLANMKILQKYRKQNSDSTVEETIVWKSNLDTLIHRRTAIIENVFDQLVLSEKKENVLNRIKEVKLDSLLNDELNKYGIKTSYGYAVVNKDSLIFTTEKGSNNALMNSNYKVKLFPSDFRKNNNFLLLDFKNREAFLFKSIWWVLLVSLLLTFLIIVLFYITIKMLIKQKKITEIKNDLLSNITHEFKTPISTISLAADVIGEETAIDSKRYSGIIKNESQRLTSMVENILQVAELESGEFKLNKTKENIHDLIKEVAVKFDLAINKINGKFTFEFKAENPFLLIDKTQMANVFSNLIDNAIKYNVNKPEIKFITMDNNHLFEIVVEDNGIGIDKKNHDKIFDTFFRVSTGNVHDVKGNGIGLSMVKKIINAHLGKIDLQSEKNRGTKFIINLPKIN